MNAIMQFLNPIANLGNKKYSIVFPLISMIVFCILFDFLAKGDMLSEGHFGALLIAISIASIIYFAFREGIRGGFIAAFFIVGFYLYYIYFLRNLSGQQLRSSLETTVALGSLYFLMAWVIGWLKQTIDELINNEADERRRIQAIFQQLPVGILITDNKGKVLRVNKQLETIMGTKIPLGYIVGKSELLVPTEYNGKPASPSNSGIVQVLATGKPILGREYTIVRNGKKVFVQSNTSPIHNKEGKIVAAASIVTDITLQKEVEERKDDFVNMASHELKTPLTSMKLYIDLLSRKLKLYKDKATLQTVDNIKGQTDRLQNLVNDLLDVSRIQTGKLTFTKDAFRIDELVAETIEELSEMAKSHTITYKKRTELTVTADKFRIYQVLTNLVTNAIKYSEEGKSIHLSVEKKGKDAVVQVRDFGIGIAKEQHKKIFDRLYQVTDSKEKTFPGFGMGLYISREIIRRHKGKIWVESEKGKGSTFFFSLPLKRGAKK